MNEIIINTGLAIEFAGILILVLGLLYSIFTFFKNIRQQSENSFVKLRQSLGKSIILSLEFLIAGDIIRTVIVLDSFESIGKLAVVIVLRTFLSFILHLEIEGRWPWQKDNSKQ